VENSQKGNAINTFIIEGGVTMGWMVELREWGRSCLDKWADTWYDV